MMRVMSVPRSSRSSRSRSSSGRLASSPGPATIQRRRCRCRCSWQARRPGCQCGSTRTFAMRFTLSSRCRLGTGLGRSHTAAIRSSPCRATRRTSSGSTRMAARRHTGLARTPKVSPTISTRSCGRCSPPNPARPPQMLSGSTPGTTSAPSTRTPWPRRFLGSSRTGPATRSMTVAAFLRRWPPYSMWRTRRPPRERSRETGGYSRICIAATLTRLCRSVTRMPSATNLSCCTHANLQSRGRSKRPEK